MLRNKLILLSLFVCLFSGCVEKPPEAAHYDLLITGGRIVDGSGNPWYRADIATRDGLIVEIGDLEGHQADRTIDAGDRVVAPGFIDMMGGSTRPLLEDPVSALSKLHQGITTILVGELTTEAPQNEKTFPGPVEVDGENVTWRTYEEYFALLEQREIALNAVHNVGAAQVRWVVLGDEDRAPTSAELEAMKALVAEAMEDGVFGLATSLIYPPATYASTEELIELAKVAAQYNGVYFSHMRNESHGVVTALEEAIRIGEDAGLPVHIYHLKAAGQDNWPLMEAALARIAQARKNGLDITADVYPYIRNGIFLGSFIHPRHYAKGDAEFVPTLSDPEVRQQLKSEIEGTYDWENWYRHVGSNWDNVLITRAENKAYVGLSIQEAAEESAVDSWQMFFDLVEQSGSMRAVGVAPKSMNEQQKMQALRAPFVAIDTDASPVNPSAVDASHPRAFGTFPRVLAKYVREEGVISLEEGIRKMTTLPANRLNLIDRGRISPGMAADLVIFDPMKIQDNATFTDPLLYSEGIDYSIINGVMVIEEGRYTDARPGRLLRAARESENSSARTTTP